MSLYLPKQNGRLDLLGSLLTRAGSYWDWAQRFCIRSQGAGRQWRGHPRLTVDGHGMTGKTVMFRQANKAKSLVAVYITDSSDAGQQQLISLLGRPDP
jgi:hypothetical protein